MYEDILDFWFNECEPQQWWRKDPDFDALVRRRFSLWHGRATRCELFAWRNTAAGRLAEILLLDQFSRNMFRDTPDAFAWDALALVLAQEAVAAGLDRDLSQIERNFLYMPYMHSESPRIHESAVALFRTNGLESGLDYELKHKRIIDRFGRYPHRNAILGRVSTAEEAAFLEQPGSGF